MNGEGFAFFRWRTLNLEHYVIPECRSQLVNWPILSEWPPEKMRRAAKLKEAERATPQPGAEQ